MSCHRGVPPRRGAPAEPLGAAAGLGDVVGTVVVPTHPAPPDPRHQRGGDGDRPRPAGGLLGDAGPGQPRPGGAAGCCAAHRGAGDGAADGPRRHHPARHQEHRLREVGWGQHRVPPPPPRDAQPAGVSALLAVRARPSIAHGALSHPQEQVRHPGLEEREDRNGEWVRGQGEGQGDFSLLGVGVGGVGCIANFFWGWEGGVIHLWCFPSSGRSTARPTWS